MAVKHHSSFKDFNGTNWHLAVHDTTYGGTNPTEFYTSDGFHLEYDGETDSRTQLIIPSTVSFTLQALNNNDLALVDAITSAKEGRFFLEIYAYGSSYADASAVLFWRGIILPDFYEIEDEYFPQSITITAMDDLAGLKDIEYREDPESTGYSKIKGQLSLALNKLRTWTITSDTNRCFLIKHLEHGTALGAGLEFWEDAEANFNVYKDATTSPPTFVSAYQALESALAATGCRIYWHPSLTDAVDSMFVVDSLHAHYEEQTEAEGYLMNSGATLTSHTFTRETINLNSTGFVRAAGWKRSYINALQEVRQSFSFDAQPFVEDWHYPHIYVTNQTVVQLTLPPTLIYGEGDRMSIRFTAKLNWEGDATLTGSNTATRWVVRVKMKIGQYYINRPLVEQPDLSVVVPDEGTAIVYNATYGTPSWSILDSSRALFISPVAIMNAGGSFDLPFALDCPPFPANLGNDDAEFSISIVAYTNTGTVASYGNQFDGDSYVREVHDYTVFPTDLIDIEGNTVIFKAQNAAGAAREIAELPTPLYTTKVGNKGGGLWVDTGTGRAQATEWHSLFEAGDLPLPSLITKHYLQGQADNLKKMFGMVYDIRTSPTFAPGFLHTFTNEGIEYALHNWKWSPNEGIHDYTLIELRKFTGLTIPDAAFEDEIPTPPSPGNGWDDSMGIGSQTTAVIQQKTDLITITNPIDLDSGTVTSVNGVSPVSGDITIDSDDIDFTGTGGGSITSAIGANTSNIDTLKSYVVSATDKIDLREDANNKIEIDGTSSAEQVTVTVAGTNALEIDDTSATFSGLVKSDGIELINASDAIVLKDSAGDRWRLQVQTDGSLRTTKL